MSVLTTQQLADALYNASELFASPMEKNFSPDAIIDLTANNWPFCIGCVVIYCLVIFLGPIIMKDRPAFDLRLPLAAWNAFLSLFSFIGMCRTVPRLLGIILSHSYKDTICLEGIHTWGSGACGFWVTLFILSKIPELIDTLFIVLRKKPLIFLHWYHHITVLLFCWSAFSSKASIGLYFVAMNFTVHAMMYGYYCLQALNMCPKSFPAYLITFSQIAQMFVGTGVCISAWYYNLTGAVCHNGRPNLIAGAVMYGSYLYLFVEFALNRFGPNKKKKAKKIE